jgi:uncharacterized protein Yka (UPF0111/DUF47 family)
MLKNLSSLNYEMFCKILKNRSISKEKVDFNSLQEEIYNNLLGEFISPIEREDIFILQKRLEEEFIAICSFSLFNKINTFDYSNVEYLLKESVSVFEELKNFKNPKKLLKFVRENKKHAIKLLTTEKCDFEKLKVLKIVEKIFSLCCEIERIILTNN